MYQFGLKIWSTNDNYVEPATKLFDKGVYDYIELFAVPDSFENTIGQWKLLKKIPFVIHAAHSTVGFNPARAEGFKRNIELAEEAFKFSEELITDTIIFHPGYEGTIAETIRQFKIIKSMFDTKTNKMIVENKPYYGFHLKKQIICNGYTSNDIDNIMRECSIDFCLDIGHAICAANALKRNPFEFLEKFYELKPRMYHLSDGDINGVDDLHLNIGKGNFDFNRILKHIPTSSRISLETEKKSDDLHDFIDDIRTVKNLILS
jgi:sugar phosphate isomerase/epimerase